jgi:hypothetical protein
MPDGDILLSCGDFANRCPNRTELDDFNNWLGTLHQYRHKIIIAGNQELLCTKDNHLAMQRDVFTNATYLVDTSCIVEGLHIYGTSWNNAVKMAFGVDDMKRAEMFAQIPECDILMTHNPPDGVLDQTDGYNGYAGQRWGDSALLTQVTKIQPRVHVFGHVHESYGYEQKSGTTFINCALKWRGGVRNPVIFDFYVKIV